MTTYQLLKANESLLRLIANNKINVTDVTHLDIYTQYLQMKEAGHKVAYIAATLSTKYGMSDRGIYKVIKRLRRGVEFD